MGEDVFCILRTPWSQENEWKSSSEGAPIIFSLVCLVKWINWLCQLWPLALGVFGRSTQNFPRPCPQTISLFNLASSVADCIQRTTSRWASWQSNNNLWQRASTCQAPQRMRKRRHICVSAPGELEREKDISTSLSTPLNFCSLTWQHHTTCFFSLLEGWQMDYLYVSPFYFLLLFLRWNLEYIFCALPHSQRLVSLTKAFWTHVRACKIPPRVYTLCCGAEFQRNLSTFEQFLCSLHRAQRDVFVSYKYCKLQSPWNENQKSSHFQSKTHFLESLYFDVIYSLD